MKKLVFILLLIIVSACQSTSSDKENLGNATDKELENESETPAFLEKKPSFTLKQGEKEINQKVISECWAENCLEESSFPGDREGGINLNKETNEIKATKLTSTEDVKISISGKVPDQLSFMKQAGSSLEDVLVENNTIKLDEKGTQPYLLTARWYKNGSFLGSKTIGFVLDVK